MWEEGWLASEPVQVSSLTQLARICPGRYFAENSVRCVFTVIQDKTDWERQIKLFISIASVLAAFDIKKAKGEDCIPITSAESIRRIPLGEDTTFGPHESYY